MPGQHRPARRGLQPRTPRRGVPLPGIGGYDYPRGPFGQTGFPGSTPAAPRTKRQDQEGRKDPQWLGRPTLTAPDVWDRDTGPAALDVTPVRSPKPQPSYGDVEFIPGTPTGPSQFLKRSGLPRNPRARRKDLTTGPEHRMTPVIGGTPGVLGAPKLVRNEVAQRWKADPLKIREYRASPNPGKTGARATGVPSKLHPSVTIWGEPDGKPVPGMYPTPDQDQFSVTVQSRYVSHEGAQEGYAMNREQRFTKGGTPAKWRQDLRPTPNHIRGARLEGDRYFGAIRDQQRIGLDSDSFGIARRRGPRHRPVRFEQPRPWTANYRDVAPDEGDQAPDMIHRSPKRDRGRARHAGRPRRGGVPKRG
jgi:hypothetical protein